FRACLPLRRRGATRAPHGEPRGALTLSRPAVTKCLSHACATTQLPLPHGEPRGDPGSGPHDCLRGRRPPAGWVGEIDYRWPSPLAIPGTGESMQVRMILLRMILLMFPAAPLPSPPHQQVDQALAVVHLELDPHGREGGEGRDEGELHQVLLRGDDEAVADRRDAPGVRGAVEMVVGETEDVLHPRAVSSLTSTRSASRASARCWKPSSSTSASSAKRAQATAAASARRSPLTTGPAKRRASSTASSPPSSGPTSGRPFSPTITTPRR